MIDIKDVHPEEPLNFGRSKEGVNLYKWTSNSKDAEELDKLANHKEKLIRKTVVLNQHAKLETLERLAEDLDVSVRKLVATNQKCSAELIEKLARDSSWEVVSSVIGSPKLSEKTLKELVEISNNGHEIRSVAMLNPNWSMSELINFANYETHPFVLDMLMRNSKLPNFMRKKFLSHSNDSIALSAKEYMNPNPDQEVEKLSHIYENITPNSLNSASPQDE